jgi:predicted  nucleic acid-binding Zn-ribbon protein
MKKKAEPLWVCLECGRGFRTTAAAAMALATGCPGCGGTDIDIHVPTRAPRTAWKPGDGILVDGADGPEVA